MTDEATSDITPDQYGVGDASYRALGGLEGITHLVERFYQLMDTLPDAHTIRQMHPADLTNAKMKLVAFLSGWSGGPPLYSERYGSRSLPVTHGHLPIDKAGEQSWLDCMSRALQDLDYPQPLCAYLMAKFAIPAEGIRLMCEHRQSATAATGLYHEVK